MTHGSWVYLALLLFITRLFREPCISIVGWAPLAPLVLGMLNGEPPHTPTFRLLSAGPCWGGD